MISPEGAVIALSRDQRSGVVDHLAHADWRSVAVPVRCRACSSSAPVSGPCSASHSATAASPSRTLSARRAAEVIHAETLTPCAAASMTCWWMSGSTVMASLGDGFPRGIPKLYDCSPTGSTDATSMSREIRQQQSWRGCASARFDTRGAWAVAGWPTTVGPRRAVADGKVAHHGPSDRPHCRPVIRLLTHVGSPGLSKSVGWQPDERRVRRRARR